MQADVDDGGVPRISSIKPGDGRGDEVFAFVVSPAIHRIADGPSVDDRAAWGKHAAACAESHKGDREKDSNHAAMVVQVTTEGYAGIPSSVFGQAVSHASLKPPSSTW